VQLGFERGQQRRAVARQIVAELVGEAREAVDREQVAPQRAGQPARSDRKVLVRRAREDLRGLRREV